MGFLSPMRIWGLAAAGCGWICLFGWLAALSDGGNKDVFDYAETSVKASLGSGQPLLYSDQRLAIWSGWWIADAGGFRLSTSRSPDILFRGDKSSSPCTLYIRAFPQLTLGQKSQQLYAKLNDGHFAGPVVISSDGEFRLSGIGSVRAGINVLTFWLPGARKMNDKDERLLGIALRSVRIGCSGAGAEGTP